MGNIHSTLLSSASAASPAEGIRSFFVLSSIFILSIQFLPSDIRSALMDYGARRPGDAASDKAQPTLLAKLKNLLAKAAEAGKVPHSWFKHFYLLSVFWSLFWATQFLKKGGRMGWLVEKQVASGGGVGGMDLGQVYIVWLLMAMQGGRRLYETLFVSKMGKSPMLLVHWVLGLAYYTAIGLAVWIEGSGAILKAWQTGDFKPQGLPSHVPFAAAAYMMAAFKQNDCHKHLASLKKYTLPSEGLFKYFLCPHYTCECALYLAMSLAAAPQGQAVNKTVLSGLLFIVTNLGSTAFGTKKWYIEKFGAEQVGKRWMMIPYVW